MGATKHLAADQSYHELHDQLSHLIAGLRYGSIELTIHDGRVVQIERREKIRLLTGGAGPGSKPDR